MNLHQGLKFTLSFLTTVCVALPAFAQDEVAPPLVEVHYPQDNLASYKERRADHGYYFSLGYEDLVLSQFISVLDGLFYKETYGSTGVALIRAGLEYKYNVALGAFALGVEAGKGEVKGNVSGAARSLSITKYGVTAKYVADQIFDEPYVAPYLGVNVWQMSAEDKSPTDSVSESTNGYNYTLGFMIQLDWIDYDTAKKSTFDYGLENTYIDIYATQYASTGAKTDPDLSTDFIFGANLRFEF